MRTMFRASSIVIGRRTTSCAERVAPVIKLAIKPKVTLFNGLLL
jgi:hypothetical protein